MDLDPHYRDGYGRPLSRITFDFVHSTAVLVDLKTGQKWAVDTWVRDSGQLPDVRPLADWYKGD